MVAKGRTDCKGIRDEAFNSLEDLISEVEKSYNSSCDVLKAHLYDIIITPNIDNEEKRSLSLDWNRNLEDIEQKAERIRKTILIGIYSFWEQSLKDICEHYSITIEHKKGSANKPYGAEDYLFSIYHNSEPHNSLMLNSGFRELRNSLVHGSQTDSKSKRHSLISAFCKEYPDFYIKESGAEFFSSSYKGVMNVLNFAHQELELAEKKAAETAKTTTNKNK